MNLTNALVFVSSGESVTILKVAESPTKDVILFDNRRATVLTEDSKTIPATKIKDFENIKPYLHLAGR